MGDVVSTAVLMATVDPWALAWRELSDLGNAERLVQRAGGRLVHVREWGWLAYDGQRWSAEDGERLAHLKAHEVAKGMRDELEALAALDDKSLPDWCTPAMRTERIATLGKHKVLSGNASKTTAMLAQAASLDDLNRRMDAFDVSPLVINTANRTLRFRRRRDPKTNEAGEWEMLDFPHDPNHHLTRIMSCEWLPGDKCPTWLKHLETVLPDPAVRAYLQQVLGYALSGLTIEQCMFLLQGRGGDGKSTTMDVVRTLMGGYAVAADVKTFTAEGTARSGAEASPDLARLAGDTRLVCTQEPKRNVALDEQRIKQFTGGSPITARMLHSDPIEFDPRGKLVMECNSRPRISGDDDGIWRRIVIILFPHQFKGEAIDKSFKTRLLDEGPGILNWLLDGLMAYLRAGRLVQPPAVIEAVEEYRRSANPFGEWMAARLDTSDPTALALSSLLYADYKQWCEAEAVSERETMTSTAFGRALGDRQIMLGPRDRTGKKQRRGARLRAVESVLLGEGNSASSSAAEPTARVEIDDWSPFDDDMPV